MDFERARIYNSQINMVNSLVCMDECEEDKNTNIRETIKTAGAYLKKEFSISAIKEIGCRD